MVFLQQFKLSIEESHNANDGNAKGCGEKHFVEHLFLLFSDLGLVDMARISSPRNKFNWRDNRPARTASKNGQGRSIALQAISAKKNFKTGQQGG